MNRRLLSYVFTITVSGGSGNASLEAFRPMIHAGGYLRQVLVQAPGNNAFDFYITNPAGRKCFYRKDAQELIADDCETPVPGIVPGTTDYYTAYIANAETDGDYTCELIFSEVY